MDKNNLVDPINLKTIVDFALRKGFVYPGSEIYGGLANTWDFGPKGVLLKENLKQAWKQHFVYQRTDMLELDAGILANQKVWEASGHVSAFADLLLDCKECKSRFRADNVIEDQLEIDVEGWNLEKIDNLISGKKMTCPKCGAKNWTKVRFMSGMFETNRDKINNSVNILTEILGKIKNGEIYLNSEDIKNLQDKLETQEQNRIYLRPETCQAIFVQFKNILNTERARLPFGIAQIGKSFRNEITPKDFIFRVIELEQMEIEYFFDPEKDNWETLFDQLLETMQTFLTQKLGFNEKNFILFEHPSEKRSHYSKKTVDILYNFSFGFKELWGLAYRTDYDLTQHSKFSSQDLSYSDPQTGKKLIPHVIEPSVGLDRLFLATLFEFLEDQETRIVLKLPFNLAPYKLAILPLMKKDGLKEKAEKIYTLLRKKGVKCDFDDTGSIGKRYRRQDENGTPFCVCVDYQTLQDETVTIRNRDTMEQKRVSIDDLEKYGTVGN
jgi:glycyl-tRNA synthetase